MTTTKQAELANELAAAFITDTRNDGATFYKLSDDAAGWMTAAVRSAHGDMFPHDWVYEQCSRVADRMSECEPERWEDSANEWADGMVDVYNADRTAWLASHLDFAGYVDEAAEEFGHSDQGVFGDIGQGQYVFITQIAAALIQAVQEEAAELEEDAAE